MLRNKKLTRLLSLIAAFSVLLTAFAGINVSAEVLSVANQRFYENFEGYGNETYTNYDSQPYEGWTTLSIGGTSTNITKLNLSSVSAGASGNAFKMGFEKKAGTDNANIVSIYRNPNIVIGRDDIVISGDVFVPETNANDGKQFIRFFVTRGLSTENVAATTDGAVAYQQYNTPAFGIFLDNENKTAGGKKWRIKVVAPISSNNYNEYYPPELQNYEITDNKWYNICYVYHPTTGDVDYYIDGKLLTSHPTGESYNITNASGNVTGIYKMPDLAPGKALGNIFLCAGGKKDAETAVMYDNISVVNTPSASNVKYAETEKGADYIFADWDIPVDKTTISDDNISVKKMAEDDFIFSGVGATEVNDYTVDFKGSNGVGIQLGSALNTAYERYQVKVSGVEDVYGNTVERVYNLALKDVVAGDTMEIKGTPFTTDFATGVAGWTESNTTVAFAENTGAPNDTMTGLLKATLSVDNYYAKFSSPDLNLPIDDTVEYVDLDFDLKPESTGSYEAYIYFANEAENANIGFFINKTRIKAMSAGALQLDGKQAVLDPTSILGVWRAYRLRYYPKKGEIEVYTGTTKQTLSQKPVFTEKTYLERDADKKGTKHFTWDTATYGDTFKKIVFRPSKASTTYIDNIYAVSYSRKQPVTALKAVTFADTNGAMRANDKLVGAKNITLHLDNTTVEPTVTLDGAAVAGTFDAVNGTYNITLDTIILGNREYTLNINGTDYTFATGAGELKVSNLRFVNTRDEKVENPLLNGEVYAAVDVINSNSEPETPYLIWAAYSGTKIDFISFDKIEAFPGFDDTVKGRALNVTEDHTTIKAFLWDGLTTLTPLLREETLTKAN